MGLFNRKKKEERNLDQKTADFIKGVDIDTGQLSNSGVEVDEETALKISAVYACVKVISETVASLPLNLLKELTNGDSEKAKQHPLYTILKDTPNSEMSSFTFREMQMTNLLLWGNAYSLIKRNKQGQIVELYPLKSKNMKVERDAVTNKIKYIYTNNKGISNIERMPHSVCEYAGNVTGLTSNSFTLSNSRTSILSS